MTEFKVVTAKNDWLNELGNFKSDWYHSWSYHEMAFKRNQGKPILFVMNNNDNERIAIPFLLRDIQGDNKYKDLTSVYGYPGFLFSNFNSKKLYDTFIKHLKSWSIENNIVSIFSRLNSLLIDAKDLKKCKSYGETVVVNLELDENKQKKFYRSVHRNLLRRLEKDGFKADWSNSQESIDDFKLIYKKNMIDLKADSYYFFDNSYFGELLNSDEFEVRIYNVWYDKLKVCSGLFVYKNDIVQYHLSGTLKKFKKSSPTLMLIDQARQDASELKFKYLHLGGGLGGQKDGLFNFKYGFSKKSIKFYFFKMIVNIEAYKKLSNLSDSMPIPDHGYFPLYRSKND